MANSNSKLKSEEYLLKLFNIEKDDDSEEKLSAHENNPKEPRRDYDEFDIYGFGEGERQEDEFGYTNDDCIIGGKDYVANQDGIYLGRPWSEDLANAIDETGEEYAEHRKDMRKIERKINEDIDFDTDYRIRNMYDGYGDTAHASYSEYDQKYSDYDVPDDLDWDR